MKNLGTIQTKGSGSTAVVAQSIGGGNAVDAFHSSRPAVSGSGGSGGKSGILPFTSGGAGGLGGVGGKVTVENQSIISTTGDAAHGVLAQSVGGGGGAGGAASSSSAFLAIALGGAGGGVGVGAFSSDYENVTVNFTVGGSGGGGTAGGQVTVRNTGTISTSGNEAHAIVAHSIGGGGGAFLMARSDGESNNGLMDPEAIPERTTKELLKLVGFDKIPSQEESEEKTYPTLSGSFTLGGSGGASGAGGEVSLTHSGTITTTGNAAFGILAQSIGGGGGLSNASDGPGGVMYAFTLGGKGGATGHGGHVRVQFDQGARIETKGSHATAVMVQSIGGGGGHGGASLLQGQALPVLGGAGGQAATAGLSK